MESQPQNSEWKVSLKILNSGLILKLSPMHMFWLKKKENYFSVAHLTKGLCNYYIILNNLVLSATEKYRDLKHHLIAVLFSL